MNIGVLKLGARLTWDAIDKTGGLGEIKALLDLLAIENIINIYTEIKDKENPHPVKNINIYNILNVSEITDDVLLVANGNINYFGGVDSPAQTKNYILLNNFSKQVFYIWIDPELYPKQIWASIANKSWSNNYLKDNIFIVRDDIKIITSIYNMKSAFEKVAKGNVSIKKENIFYFPFEKYPLLQNVNLPTKESCVYDLLYMGTYRGGKRQDKMLKFYFGHQKIKSTFIGKTKLENFTKSYKQPTPEFKPPVEFEKIKHDINDSIASVCIGDKFYEGNILTPRIYECILYNTVCFIDIDLDKKKQIFKNSLLQEFNYVSSSKEVEDKILQLKNDSNFRDNIITLQKSDIDFDKNMYYNQFMNIVNPKLKQIERPWCCKELNLSQITEWDSINYYKQTYILDKNPSIKYLKFPGFIFSSTEDMTYYYDNFYKNIKNVFTPPRGNLSQSCKYAFIGIQPGKGAQNSKGESCWLIGETSTKMLYDLLYYINVYPYFTNVYLDYTSELHKDTSIIEQEIKIIKKIVPDIKLVFMGSYDEYDKIILNLNLNSNEYKRIWHPAFLLRSFTDEKFKQWGSNFK